MPSLAPRPGAATLAIGAVVPSTIERGDGTVKRGFWLFLAFLGISCSADVPTPASGSVCRQLEAVGGGDEDRDAAMRVLHERLSVGDIPGRQVHTGRLPGHFSICVDAPYADALADEILLPRGVFTAAFATRVISPLEPPDTGAGAPSGARVLTSRGGCGPRAFVLDGDPTLEGHHVSRVSRPVEDSTLLLEIELTVEGTARLAADWADHSGQHLVFAVDDDVLGYPVMLDPAPIDLLRLQMLCDAGSGDRRARTLAALIQAGPLPTDVRDVP